MRCPYCGFLEDRVIDSRSVASGDATRRRRECVKCERRFTTYERIEEVYPRVIKRDGSREDYDRAKIMHGLKLACSKRAIATEALDRIVERVEERLRALGAREVASEAIGSMIASELRELDAVAYLRFASVYRNFSDIGEFLRELGELGGGADDE